MSFKDKLAGIIKAVGPTALSFIPGVGPVLANIAKVSSVIGGENGSKIEKGLAMVTEGIASIGKEPLSPDKQVELEKAQMETAIQLKEIAFKDKKLDYDDQAGGRDVIKTALMSDDPLVRQARPKMMIALGKAAMWYSFLTPLIVGCLAAFKVEKDLLSLVVQLILWQGGTLWATFSASFTGYTIARSADKNIIAKRDMGIEPSKMIETLAALGKKIS